MRFKDDWGKMSLRYKIIAILRLVLSVFVVAYSILGLSDVINIRESNNVAIPVLGVVIALNGVDSLRTNKALAIFSFVAAFFIFITTLFVYNL